MTDAFTPNMRDIEKRPYSADELRVCEYLQKLAPDIGCGDDPIGLLLASHAAQRLDFDRMTEDLESLQRRHSPRPSA